MAKQENDEFKTQTMQFNRFIENNQNKEGEFEKGKKPEFVLCSINKFFRTENVKKNVDGYLANQEITDAFDPTPHPDAPNYSQAEHDQVLSRGEYFTTLKSHLDAKETFPLPKILGNHSPKNPNEIRESGDYRLEQADLNLLHDLNRQYYLEKVIGLKRNVDNLNPWSHNRGSKHLEERRFDYR